MPGHSRFAPSATERETLCAPSFLLNEQLPDVQTFDSAHGTAAHHVAQLCLKHDQDVTVYAGCNVAVTKTGDCRFAGDHKPPTDEEMTFEVDEEMESGVQSYVDWCRQLPGDHFVEIRVEHTRWCPDFDEWGDPLPPQFGTADHIACTPRVLYVTDLKYGKGVKVFAFKNKQATKYALGAWQEYNWLYGFEKVVIRIAQPRLDHFDEWEVSIQELLAYGEELKTQLEEVWNPEAPFNPSEKACKFCKAAARCKPLAEYLDSTRALAFEDEDKTEFVSTNLLSIEELVQAWRRHGLYQLRYDAIARELMDSLRGGTEIEGLKLVNAQAHRVWVDPIKVRATLRSLGVTNDKMEKRKLVSPAQAEKLLTKDLRPKLADLWRKPLGGPAIVDASDPRPPYQDTPVIEGFEDEDDDDGFND